MVSRRSAARGRGVVRIRCRGCMRQENSIASVSVQKSMKAMKEDENQRIVEGEVVVLTRTYYLEEVVSELQPMLTKESLMKRLPTSIPNAANHTLAQDLKMLGSVSVRENPWNQAF